MGYRQYFYAVEKSLIEEARKCRTEKELYELCSSKNIKCEHYEEDGEDYYYCPVYKWGDEVYEFGKYYENSKGIEECGYPLFDEGSKLAKDYVDYNAYVVSKEAIKSAIEHYRDKVINIYQDLLKEKSSNSWDKRSQLERLKKHASDYLLWWEYNAYNLDKSTPRIVNSWLYEHAIFELVRIYKTFDFDKYELLFMGW